MKPHSLLLSVLLLPSCSFAPKTTSPSQSPLATQDVVSTTVASGPMIELAFDGTACTFAGPIEVPLGALVTKFTNTSSRIAMPYVARNYPGKTWQDVLNWLEANPSKTPGWIAILGYDRSVSETPAVSYRLYNLDLEGEYHIVAESSASDQIWPCGPFTVVPPQ